jgi:RNA polymerase sigma factor (sigma-70 family)
MRSRQGGRQVPPARGDEPELLRRFGLRLERVVAQMAPWAPPWLIEEGCGHAWEQLIRHQPERTSVFAWLRTVAYREVLRLNRKKVRESSLDAELTARDGEGEGVFVLDRLPALADRHDTETALEAREALRAVAGLRWRQRRVITLRLAGYSYKEIANKLGVTYTNVNRHITEGRAELRELRDAA